MCEIVMTKRERGEVMFSKHGAKVFISIVFRILIFIIIYGINIYNRSYYYNWYLNVDIPHSYVLSLTALFVFPNTCFCSCCRNKCHTRCCLTACVIKH
jgi:hypothetical protein